MSQSNSSRHEKSRHMTQSHTHSTSSSSHQQKSSHSVQSNTHSSSSSNGGVASNNNLHTSYPPTLIINGRPVRKDHLCTTLTGRDRPWRPDPPRPNQKGTTLTGRDRPGKLDPQRPNKQGTTLKDRDRPGKPDPPRPNPESSRTKLTDRDLPKPHSMAMANAKSIFTHPKDQEMASRQKQIETMSGNERAKQDKWAKEQLMKNAGACNNGWNWHRVDGGYRCTGSHHLVTDELLAEGRGGFYRCTFTVQDDRGFYHIDLKEWFGPYYSKGKKLRI